MSAIAPPPAPASPPVETAREREQARTERRVSIEAEVWLAHQTLPASAVLWYPLWDERRPVAVTDRDHLVALIATLERDCFGGIRLHGSSGPWAQVIASGDGEFCIELHPRMHSAPPGGMYFERVWPVHAASASALAWAWVHRQALPAGHSLEPRVVPKGQMYDQAISAHSCSAPGCGWDSRRTRRLVLSTTTRHR